MALFQYQGKAEPVLAVSGTISSRAGTAAFTFTPAASATNVPAGVNYAKSASVSFTLTVSASATLVPAVTALPVRVTQLPIEVLHSKFTTSTVYVTQLPIEVARLAFTTSDVRVTQLAIEVLTPYVPPEIKYKDAAVSFSLTVAASGTTTTAPGVYTKSAAVSFSLTASASASGLHLYAKSAAVSFTVSPVAVPLGIHVYVKSASVSFVLTASASEIFGGSIPTLSAVTITFTPVAVADLLGAAKAAVTIRFRVRAKVKKPIVVFADNYLGRFQLGQVVPLLVVVKDAVGRPTDPTESPPVATVYALDDPGMAESVEVPRLRGSRVRQVYSRSILLGSHYTEGRYAVVYRSPVGGFVGMDTQIFEVVAGGRTAGPAQAMHAMAHPSGTEVIVQDGSGALLAGRSPRVS